MKSKGFTLIELLVVIAVIGLLASVVLASLNTARNKGADASIKESLANLRPQAELYYSSLLGNGTYGAVGNCRVSNTGVVTSITGVCTGLMGNVNFSNTMKFAAKKSGVNAWMNTGSAPTRWAAWAKLPAKANTWQCVDSTGVSKTLTSVPSTTAVVCP